jgi:predicted nucleotidyltransferase
MVTREQIDAAVRILAEAGGSARIILFGSHARGDARENSDLDFLVIRPRVEDRAREMVRLRRLLRPLRVPADILVFSVEEVARRRDQPGCLLYWALREGRVVHGRAEFRGSSARRGETRPGGHRYQLHNGRRY